MSVFRYLITILLTVSAIACDISVSSTIPISKNGVIKHVQGWGALPKKWNINSNSYDKLKYDRDLGATFAISFYKNDELIHSSSEVKSIKGLFYKYVVKGSDKAVIIVKNKNTSICTREVKLWPGD